MFSANYSLNCTTFDPKGKILQVSHPLTLTNSSLLIRLTSLKKP